MFEPREIFDVIDPQYSADIYNTVTDLSFDWHFMNDTTYEDRLDNEPAHSTPSFANLVYHYNQPENPRYDYFKPLLLETCNKAGLELETVLRMRLGFLMNTKYPTPSFPYQYNTPHVDFEQDHYVACYYVNTTDGDTVVFHETEELPTGKKYKILKKSTPLQGKVLVFNGRHFHASSCPKVHVKRIVLTMNFTARQKDVD